MLAVCIPYDQKAQQPGNGNMVAIPAGSREKVDQLYAKARELGFFHRNQVLAHEQDLARVGVIESGQERKQRRFPAPGLSDDRHRLADVDRERNPLENVDSDACLLKVLFEVLGFKDHRMGMRCLST